MLVIGLTLLAVFVIGREYGFLVPGAIITGVGVGVALTREADPDVAGALLLLSLAGGFLGIWVLGSLYRLRQDHWWPLIPGGILTIIGVVQLSDAGADGALRWWPVILMLLGALILGRALGPR